jgi:hypothetical protein
MYGDKDKGSRLAAKSLLNYRTPRVKPWENITSLSVIAGFYPAM